MTKCTARSASVRAPLTALEKDVMQVVWDQGRCAVEAVHQEISKKHNLKETSVRTILRRLEQKGYLSHDVEGQAYVYRATEPARRLAARAVRQIIDSFCRGSIEELVSGMVEAKVLTKAELDSLEGFVRDRKPEGR
jgi:predicted transcriptional regulator